MRVAVGCEMVKIMLINYRTAPKGTKPRDTKTSLVVGSHPIILGNKIEPNPNWRENKLDTKTLFSFFLSKLCILRHCQSSTTISQATPQWQHTHLLLANGMSSVELGQLGMIFDWA